MRTHVGRVSVGIACLCVIVWGQAPQPPPATGSPFAGRWEIQLKQKTESASMPMFIIELAGAGTTLTGHVVDTMASPMTSATMKAVSLKGDELVFVIDANILRRFTLTFHGKRQGDHLEGTATAEEDPEPQNWVGQSTTRDKLTPSAPTAPSAESKAFTAAMLKETAAERVDALKEFLNDYPDTKMKEQARLQLAESAPTPRERIAALRTFLDDFPNSTLEESAHLQIALAPTAPSERAAALHKFIDEFPASRLKDQAEYELIDTTIGAAARQAAQEAFVKANPKSPRASMVYRSLLDAYLRARPIDEARLGATIDAFIETTIDMKLPMGEFTMDMKADAMNTVADRLMVNEVMLDKALDLIEKAVRAAGDKEAMRTRAIYTTTLGQVLFKLKRYDEAERELIRATTLAGSQVDGEAELFLGKLYEAKHDEAAALDHYFKSAAAGPTADTKASLRRVWTARNGSVAGLDEKLDEIYRARPRPFDPGQFARPAGQERVVMAELFTGAECVPCVAADLAFEGVRDRYDRTMVAVLEYHVHIPGPDPMTNADAEARAKYYDVRSAPTMIVDGSSRQSGGGGADRSEGLFNLLKDQIESRMGKPPLATLAGFRATVVGQTITVSGEADLAPSTTERKATLHVALIEDSVRYVGANGVRFNDFVVRSLLGSPAGQPMAAPGASTNFSGTVDVAAIGATLDEYLKTFEQRESRANAPFAFSDRVDHLDPAKLRIVAFVQDDVTREILQAVFVEPKR